MDPIVILATDTVSAGPGEEARLLVRVRNQGRRVEAYRIELVGEPSRFGVVEPPTVSVLPGKEAEVTITFRPPGGAQTPTGSLPFAVRAISEVGSSASAVAEGRLELAGAAGLQAWAENAAASGRWSAKYRLTFANQGNAPVRLALTAHDPAAGLKFTLSDEVVDLPPGGQVATDLRAKTRQPFLRGSPVNRTFTASCQDFPFGAARPIPGQVAPQDDPHHRTFQLSFQQKPILSKLAVLASLLVVGLLVALVVLRLRGDDEVVLGMARPDAPPTFTAAPGGSNEIFLSWGRVPNAAGYDIRRTTNTGQVSGPVVESVDAVTFTYVVGELGPGEAHCFAVAATGPEGVESSPLSQFACATTTAVPQVAAPVNLVATPLGAGSFDVSWEYPGPIEGLTFTVFADNDPVKPDIAGLFTTVDVPQLELTREVRLTVRAVSGEQMSNASNEQLVTVEAAAAAETTTTAGPTTVAGAPTTVPGGPGVPPGPGAPTTAPSATTAAPTTTAPPTPAQSALQDLDETWVAMIGPVVPDPAGTGTEAQRTSLAATFGVAPEQIRTFSNRDTVARDAAGASEPTVTAGSPDDEFFYVAQHDEGAAIAFCAGDIRCEPMILEGAGKAAVGTDVLILDRLDATTLLDELDGQLLTLRTDLARQAIHALDASRRPQFGTNQIIVVADGFASTQAVNDFCVAHGITRCTPVRLEG